MFEGQAGKRRDWTPAGSEGPGSQFSPLFRDGLRSSPAIPGPWLTSWRTMQDTEAELGCFGSEGSHKVGLDGLSPGLALLNAPLAVHVTDL